MIYITFGYSSSAWGKEALKLEDTKELWFGKILPPAIDSMNPKSSKPGTCAPGRRVGNGLIHP